MWNERSSPSGCRNSTRLAVDGAPLVLVVEDDDDSRDMLIELIRTFGLRAQGASSAREVFARTPIDPWTIAVIDLNLPDTDGYEIARRLRALPASAERRLVALTGYCGQEVRSAAGEAGFDAFLVKPVLPEQLFEALGAPLAPRS